MMWILPRSSLARTGAALRAILALLLLGACHSATDAAPGDPTRLLGRWTKLEKSLPAVSLELRASTTSFTGYEGQVWLSGVTYTLPARLDDSSAVVTDPVSSGPAPLVVVLQKDGALRATLGGETTRQERLVRQ